MRKERTLLLPQAKGAEVPGWRGGWNQGRAYAQPLWSI